jgi:hypothetical protein
MIAMKASRTHTHIHNKFISFTNIYKYDVLLSLQSATEFSVTATVGHLM